MHIWIIKEKWKKKIKMLEKKKMNIILASCNELGSVPSLLFQGKF
jgi:hypothetical protein